MMQLLVLTTYLVKALAIKKLHINLANMDKNAASYYKKGAVSGIIPRPSRFPDPEDSPPGTYIQAQKLHKSNQRNISRLKILPSASTRAKKATSFAWYPSPYVCQNL